MVKQEIKGTSRDIEFQDWCGLFEQDGCFDLVYLRSNCQSVFLRREVNGLKKDNDGARHNCGA